LDFAFNFLVDSKKKKEEDNYPQLS